MQSVASRLAFRVGTFAIAEWMDVASIATVLAILSALVGLAVCILLYRDALRRMRDTNAARAGVLAILSFPIRLLGLVSVVIGIGTLSWVMYNMFVERQPEFRPGSTKQFLALVVFVAYGWRWLLRPLDPPTAQGDGTSSDSTTDFVDEQQHVD